MKIKLIFLLILLPLNNVYAETTELIRNALEEKGYFRSEDSILKDVLNLSKEEEETILSMAKSDRAKMFADTVHRGEKLCRAGVTVVKVSGQETICSIPQRNSKYLNASELNLYYRPGHHTEQEMNIFNKIGKRMVDIIGCRAAIIDISTLEDKEETRSALAWHQDAFAGVKNTDVLLFAVLEREKCTQGNADPLPASDIQHKHEENFQRIGRVSKNKLLARGFVHKKYACKVEECEKLCDKKGAGYLIDQRHNTDDKKVLVHSRDYRGCASKRTSIIVRATSLDEKSGSLKRSGQKSAEEAFKVLYLSDPAIAKALCRNYLIEKGLDMSVLTRIAEAGLGVNLYYEVMAGDSVH